MTIIRKTNIEKHIEQFEQRYRKLQEILHNTELNMNIWDQYSKNPNDHKRDFMEINPVDFIYAINDCKASLAELVKFKNHKEPRLQSGN